METWHFQLNGVTLKTAQTLCSHSMNKHVFETYFTKTWVIHAAHVVDCKKIWLWVHECLHFCFCVLTQRWINDCNLFFTLENDNTILIKSFEQENILTWWNPLYRNGEILRNSDFSMPTSRHYIDNSVLRVPWKLQSACPTRHSSCIEHQNAIDFKGEKCDKENDKYYNKIEWKLKQNTNCQFACECEYFSLFIIKFKI